MSDIVIPSGWFFASLTAVGGVAVAAIKALWNDRQRRALTVEVKANAKELKSIVRHLEQRTGSPSSLPPPSNEFEDDEELRTKPAIIVSEQMRAEIERLTRQFVEEQDADERRRARADLLAEAREREANRGHRLQPTDLTPPESPASREHSRRLTPQRPRHEPIESPLPPPPPKKR